MTAPSPGPGPGHVVVVAAPDVLADPGAALEVLDRALERWGATGELVLAGSVGEVRDTVAHDHTAPELVVLPGVTVDASAWADGLPPGCTVLRVDLEDRPRDPSPAVRRHLRGRGVEGLAHAVDTWVLHRTHPPTLVHRYGPDRDQYADLRLPGTATGRTTEAATTAARVGHPVAVLVHGGYWRSRWESDLMEPMAADLTARGWATWNVEYRRPDDHGWDATTADVAAALRALADVDADPGAGPDRTLDLDRVVTLGHSAGGQLVTRLSADVAADPSAPVRPALTVSLAGVLDLVDGDRRRLGDGAVARALGGAARDLPDRYRASSPIARVPVGSPLAVVCGHDDELLGQSRAFARAARDAGDDVVVVEAAGDHGAVIDPRSGIWPDVVRVIEQRVIR